MDKGGDKMWQRLSGAGKAARDAMLSSRGKDVLLYLLFVAVAFVFWALLSLDAEVTKDYDIPVVITEVPDSVHIIGNVPAAVNVTVRSRGAQQLPYLWGTMPTLHLRFADYAAPRSTRFYLSRTRLSGVLRDFFGPGISVTSWRPDSIAVPFTRSPGVKVPLHVVADVSTNLQCTVSGPIRATVDSVTLYALNPQTIKAIEAVNTEPLTLTDLKDTTRVEVSVAPIEGVKAVPAVVTVTVPVEPLISKRREVPIDVLGLPEGTSLITFPSKAEVSYLVPMSAYNHDYPVRIFVDYAGINKATGKVALQVGAVPPPYTSLTFKPDSVEFIIEHH